MRELITSVLEVAGAGVVAVGAAMVYVPAGVMVAGAAMVVFGYRAAGGDK